MGHDVCDRLRDYWTRAEQFFTPFHPNTMTQDCFLHILSYLHFTDNDKEVNYYDRLFKVREVFYILSVAYLKFYNLSEHMVIDKVMVLFKRKVAFKQYIPGNTNVSELKFMNSMTLMATHMTWKCT